MPDVYDQFVRTAQILEKHYRDMQDMEYTIQGGKLFMLQTRNGKRTAASALKIACDLVEEGMITKEEALLKIDPKALDALLHPTFDPAALKKANAVATGLAASPAPPAAAYTSPRMTLLKPPSAAKRSSSSALRPPRRYRRHARCAGILTARGGLTSHAAVVARGMGTCCVAGCGDVRVFEAQKYCSIGGNKVSEGEWISLNGSTGKVYLGAVETKPAEVSGNFATIMAWADEYRVLKVYTNADTPHDAAKAVEFGAEGIGLTRTEHMFFNPDRIPAMREMIVSNTEEERRKALAKILPMQIEDFKGIYKAMEGRPVTIRFLDPPLHEFLPTAEDDIVALAKEMGITVDELKGTIAGLHEFNPMMGHRGCRLTVTYPEIAEMQTRAVITAAVEVREETGLNIVPEIMIPLVGEVKELKFVKDIVVATAEKVMKARRADRLQGRHHDRNPPRLHHRDEIAAEADFFSFGTNDLTQMTFGFSRDDAGKFLGEYYSKKIYESDPFARVDQKGVGKLMQMAVTLGRGARPDLKLGICGEHGGDPSSVEFCHKLGLNYVSCSPFRVPIARLAAAQAAISGKTDAASLGQK